jgi:SWI/SNF-related matrix-associated actin-dependent regulator of chromatin subfamily A-like protein 1
MQKYKFNFSQKTKPFPHQIEAVTYIEEKPAVALFDEQGLGKTKIVIDALCLNMENQVLSGALIICRKNLIANWQDEINTHSYLKSIVLRGTPKEKGTRFMGYAHFYIINYESVHSEFDRIKMFLEVRKFAIVLDESHAIKNPESVTAKIIHKLSIYSIKRIIISGTPIANKPEDLWSQYYFLDQGKLLGNNFKVFKSMYLADLKDSEKMIGDDKFGQLRQIIDSSSIRRLKKDVLKLPEKIYIDKEVVLNNKQLLMYNQVRDELYLEIENVDGEIIIDENDELLKKLLRLAQIASNPRLIDQSYDQTPAKFPVLDGLINEIISKDEKVIVWSCFVGNIIGLVKHYKEFGAQSIYGDMTIEKRNLSIDRFKNDKDAKILFANPAAAKEGLTLTVANNAIYLDRNFNLVDYLQSQDRIHRISQNKECRIYKIIAKNTIDEYIDEIISKKNSLAGFLQGDTSELKFTSKLTREDILEFMGKKIRNNG